MFCFNMVCAVCVVRLCRHTRSRVRVAMGGWSTMGTHVVALSRLPVPYGMSRDVSEKGEGKPASRE